MSAAENPINAGVIYVEEQRMVLQPDKEINKIETVRNILDIRHNQFKIANFYRQIALCS